MGFYPRVCVRAVVIAICRTAIWHIPARPCLYSVSAPWVIAPLRSAIGRVAVKALMAGPDNPGQVSMEVARGGVEPPTFRFSVGRSYQLSYLARLG